MLQLIIRDRFALFILICNIVHPILFTYTHTHLICIRAHIHSNSWGLNPAADLEFSAEKIVWEREKYQDYTVCRAIDSHFPYLCSVTAINCQKKHENTLYSWQKCHIDTKFLRFLWILPFVAKSCRHDLRTFSAEVLTLKKQNSFLDWVAFRMYG